jgi:predicted phosphodiesterase
MRLAALYDIHGNLPALEAVLVDVRRAGVDRIVVGGDVVPGPMARETMDCLFELDIPPQFILGNGDREVLNLMRGVETGVVPPQFLEALRWNAQQLGAENERRISSWPATLRMEVPGLGAVLFCHATPRNDTDIFTRLTAAERLEPLFRDAGAPVVVCGHTHMQFDRMIGNTRVVNAGSVGMPFGEPGAYWLLIDARIELRHTPYDLPHAAARIRATGYPQAEAFAERNVLNPPRAQDMLDAFSRAELK